MYDRLKVTYKETIRIMETKIYMLLYDYEIFSMRDEQPISLILHHFANIINGFTSLNRHLKDSKKVKKNLAFTS